MTDEQERFPYPLGRFHADGPISAATRSAWIEDLASAPQALRQTFAGLTEEQLETPYRPGGWTVRQVVHHLPDSHMNAYVRFKLALTEDEPVIKTYQEDRWAELSDGRMANVEVSMALFDSLHVRWTYLLRSLSPEDFSRHFKHPDMGICRLDTILGMYAWHGRHHVAHIAELRKRQGWNAAT